MIYFAIQEFLEILVIYFENSPLTLILYIFSTISFNQEKDSLRIVPQLQVFLANLHLKVQFSTRGEIQRG